MKYTVNLSVNNYNEKAERFEFMWLGKEMRTSNKKLQLVVEGDSIDTVIKVIGRQSEDTLEVLHIVETDIDMIEKVETAENDKYMSMYMDLCLPKTNVEIIQLASKNPATIGNN